MMATENYTSVQGGEKVANVKEKSFSDRLETTAYQTAFLFEAADALFSSRNEVTGDAIAGFFLLSSEVTRRLFECVSESFKLEKTAS